jgi:hypothetical protein
MTNGGCHQYTEEQAGRKGKKMSDTRDKQGYVNEFLGLNCAGDVLNVVNPLGPKAKKEISESMAVIRVLRGITLKRPMELQVIDLCAGNALTSVLAVHLLPVKAAVAVDRRKRARRWSAVKRFKYVTSTIKDYQLVCVPSVIIAVHPCKTAVEVIEYFRLCKYAEYLIMMPCCEGGINKNKKRFTRLEMEKFGRYEQWCMYLAEICRYQTDQLGPPLEVDVFQDKRVLSPCNIVITARKKG